LLLLISANALARGPKGLASVLYTSAATAPALGWLLDRIGRASLFVIVGALLQLGSLLALIVDDQLRTSLPLNIATEISLGVAWAGIACGGWESLALLVPVRWLGRIFAMVVATHSVAVAVVPLYLYLATPMLVIWIATATCTVVGIALLGLLYFKKSILNMSAHGFTMVAVSEEDSLSIDVRFIT